MTEQEQLNTLELLNHSLKVLKEIQSLPRQTELSMHRAIAAAKAANEAMNELESHLEAQSLLERVES